ncbi:MAG: hypothetical protein ABI461_15470 [Polyangiaceae bacterium]
MTAQLTAQLTERMTAQLTERMTSPLTNAAAESRVFVRLSFCSFWRRRSFCYLIGISFSPATR